MRDRYLVPIAAVLRMLTAGPPMGEYVTLEEARRLEEAESAYLAAATDWRWQRDYAPVEQGLAIERGLENVRNVIRLEKERIARLGREA